MINHSPSFEKIKKWHEEGLWTDEMVYKAVPKMITAEEYTEITGKPYSA